VTKTEEKYYNEKVPYRLPIDRTNPDNTTEFVSVNDYTCYIKRGVEVMIPRKVALVLDAAEKAKDEAYFRSAALSEDYEEQARRYRA